MDAGLAKLLPSLSMKKQDFIKAVDVVCKEINSWKASLDQDKAAFAVICHEVDQLNMQQAECEYLDVGGTVFHTSKQVLFTGEQHFFSILTSGDFASEKDEDGYYFIDRDSQWFSSVLAYLRDGWMEVPREATARLAFGREARFYMLQKLFDATQEEECIIVLGRGMVQTYYPVTSTWHAVKMDHLAPLAAAKVGRELYVANSVPGHFGHLLMLDRRTGRFQWLSDLPDHFHIQAGVGIQDHLVFLGFVSSGPRRLELRAFNVRDHVWTTWGDSKQSRHKFAACELGGSVVIIGGRDLQANPLRTVEKYRGDEIPQWQSLPDLTSKRSRPAALAWVNRLVVIGGYNNENGSLSTVEEFNPVTQLWSPLPSLRTPRIGCKAVLFDEELVVVGGFPISIETEFKTVERYNAREKRWKPMPSMCEAPIDPCVAVLSIPSAALPHFI